VLRRDRLIVAGALAGVALLAWAYLVSLAVGEGAMPGMSAAEHVAMVRGAEWSAAEALATVLMWAVMMVGMMVPAAAPTVLIFATVCRRRALQPPETAAAAMVAGYLAVWAAFSAVATALEWGLGQIGAAAPMAGLGSGLAAGAVLVLVGAHQWLPHKRACLDHCRSPVDFLARHWRSGIPGAFVMGMHHGLYCLGCCWALMGLLFVVGSMNLVWVAALSIYVLAEKAWRHGAALRRPAGAAFALAGVLLILAAL
jgi:predicted metal-binding membrane protein